MALGGSQRSWAKDYCNYPHWTFGASGEIPDWSAMIEAIERQGWVLAHWSAGVDAKGNPQAYPVFRRRQ